ncbi:metal-dependent transcriptional regulator [Persicobacter psychrovividus]|uniref:Transcriptional regulator MntR n=1 Tax=Persicobacter psychrovividus TaxID=387638 RepID=A0ABM7VD76_9BACT|nr:iron-dependent repressor [Persicobacter psychrovividus]
MDLSFVEENYLKAIYQLQLETPQGVSTTSIAELTKTKPASVSDMLKKLSNKALIHYKKYQGATLSESGMNIALLVIRKHRLWEVFLVKHLNFTWSEVHEVAEQLEHIDSALLISRLDQFLGYPKQDPHGDPIPDAEGNIKDIPKILLSELKVNTPSVIAAVKENNPLFLQYLDKIKASINADIMIKERIPFDNSLEIILSDRTLYISEEVAKNIYVSEK